MKKLFVDYLERLQRLHDDIKQSIEGLPQAALDWIPGPEMNSLCIIVAHVSGSERYWLGDIIAQAPSDRDREAEFRTQGVDVSGLIAQLDGSLAYGSRVVEGLGLEDLETPRVSPRDGREVTVGWALFHVLEHVAVHLGHVQLTRQMWEQR
jgi:hypothetical protein